MKAWRGTKICVTTSNISYIIMHYLSPRFDPRLSYFDSLHAFFFICLTSSVLHSNPWFRSTLFAAQWDGIFVKIDEKTTCVLGCCPPLKWKFMDTSLLVLWTLSCLFLNYILYPDCHQRAGPNWLATSKQNYVAQLYYVLGKYDRVLLRTKLV